MSTPSRATLAATAGLQYGKYPQKVICPYCQKTNYTRTERSVTTKTHFLAICLCLTIPFLACLPYCVNSCKAVDHYCAECGNFLGSYQP